MLEDFETAYAERERFVEQQVDALGRKAVMDRSDIKECARLLAKIDDVRSSVNDTLYTPDKQIVVVQAYNRGMFEHFFHYRKNKDQYFQGHLVPTAFNLVKDMGITSLLGILAAFMHDDIEDLDIAKNKLIGSKEFTGLLSPEFCQNEFAKIQSKLPDLVEGVTKVKKTSREATKEATFKKLLEACCVLLLAGYIKLADRTNNMETLEGHGIAKAGRQREIAEETEKIYIRLAHILELPEVEKKLTEYCFQTLNPEVYQEWKKWMAAKFKEFVEPYEEKIKDQFRAGNAYMPGIISIETAPIELRRPIYGNTKRRNEKTLAQFDFEDIKLSDEDPGSTYVIMTKNKECIPAVVAKIIEKFGSGIQIEADIKPMNYRRGLFVKVYNKAFGGIVYFRINDIESEIRSRQGVLNSERKGERGRLQNEMRRVITESEGTDTKTVFDLAENNLLRRNIIIYKKDGTPLMLKSGSTALDMAIAIHTDFLIGAQSAESSESRWESGKNISLFAPLPPKHYVRIRSCLEKNQRDAEKIRARSSWLPHCGTEAQRAIRHYLRTLSVEDRRRMGEEDVKQFCETFGLNFYQSIKNLTKGLKKREHMEVYENIGGGTIDLLEKLDSKKDERAWVIEIELPNIPGKEAEFREQIFGQEINVDKNETLPFGDNGSSLVTLEVSFSTEGEHALTRKDFMKRILRAKLDGYKITAKPIRG